VKFLASNVDFISLSPDALGLKRPAHEGVKEGYLSKKWVLIWCLFV